jgi:hypothetical protein
MMPEIELIVFLVIVATATMLAIYFRCICCYKSKEIITTSLPVDEPIIVVAHYDDV